MPQITFVRHGTTENMERSILNGVTHSPLSARGREEAQRVAAALRGRSFDAFYASPIGRAMETAQAIAEVLEMQPVPLDDLRELDFGWMENRRLMIPASSNLPGLRDLMWRFCFGVGALTGESLAKLQSRVIGVIPALLNSGSPEHILVVSHTVVHRAFAAHFSGHSLRTKEHSFYIEPCAYSEFELDADGELVEMRLNQTEHLAGVG